MLGFKNNFFVNKTGYTIYDKGQISTEVWPQICKFSPKHFTKEDYKSQI
jgi:hypothetical protein